MKLAKLLCMKTIGLMTNFTMKILVSFKVNSFWEGYKDKKNRPTLDLRDYNFSLQFEIPDRFDQVEDQCQNGNHSLPPLFTRPV